MESFQQQIDKLKNASPIDVPSILCDMELHDEQSAFELFEELSKKFDKEDLVDNIVNPSICTVVDGILALPCFNGLSKKAGLSSQRIMNECKEFNYDGQMSYLMPDSFVEYCNVNPDAIDYSKVGGKYDRSLYQNTYEMNRYKQQRIRENGGRVNMEDEYRLMKDISGTKAGIDKRLNDPKGKHVAETDHIIPLKTVFEQAQDVRLSDGDIKLIANQDYNLAVTGRIINNPKRYKSNSEFIANQERLKAEGKPYLDLSDTQKENMIKMELEAQQAIETNIRTQIEKNLSGEGTADSDIRKAALEERKHETGGQLTDADVTEIDKRLGKEKAIQMYKTAAKQNLGNAASEACEQSLLYALGDVTLLIIKPLYYEIKDGFINGFAGGVCAGDMGEALKIRFHRIKEYVWSQLKDIGSFIGEGINFIKNFISSMLESLLTMFVGIFKQFARIIKEGVKIIMQTATVLFGANSKSYTATQKADAVVKIVGTSAVAILGIGIDSYLKTIPGIPDTFKGVISTLLSGLAATLLFYALDKIDLFNIKADRRNDRIKEIFDMRIQDVKNRTSTMNDALLCTLNSSSIDMELSIERLSTAATRNDTYCLCATICEIYRSLLGKTLEIDDNRRDWNC